MDSISRDQVVGGDARSGIGWLFVGAFAAATFAQPFMPHIAPTLAMSSNFILIAFGIWHGAIRYGLQRMLAAVGIIFVIGMVLENVSIVTGFPFGYFQHTDVFGPKLLHVPILVAFLYFTLAYSGWSLANLYLGEADRDVGRLSMIALPLVAMFIPPALDASFDPLGATLARSWIFVHGGGYFGVPLTNFLGIMLVNYIYYQLFALYLHRRPNAVRTGQGSGYWMQPALIVGVLAIAPALGMMTHGDVTVADPAGRVWHSSDIYEGLTVMGLCCLGFLSVTGVLLALRGDSSVRAGSR